MSGLQRKGINGLLLHFPVRRDAIFTPIPSAAGKVGIAVEGYFPDDMQTNGYLALQETYLCLISLPTDALRCVRMHKAVSSVSYSPITPGNKKFVVFLSMPILVVGFS